MSQSKTETASGIEVENELHKITMTTVSILLLLFTLLAFVALRRTKSTPATARFLSSGLLLFDMTSTLTFTLRRFVVNRALNIIVHVFGIYCLVSAMITVGIMSAERLILFSSPNFYLRNVTPWRVKQIVTSIWIVMTVVYFFVRYGLCFALNENATIYDVIGRCNNVSYAYYFVLILITCISSVACYTRIFLIERAKVKHDKSISRIDTLRGLMKYKTTSIVFLYVVCIVMTLLSYTYVLTVLRSDHYTSRIVIDITNLVSCVIDPCLYVLWFRESRYEVLKMVRFVSPRLEDKLEHMRLEIFNVVLVDRIVPQSTTEQAINLDSTM